MYTHPSPTPPHTHNKYRVRGNWCHAGAAAVLRFSGSAHLFFLWLSGYSFIQAWSLSDLQSGWLGPGLVFGAPLWIQASVVPTTPSCLSSLSLVLHQLSLNSWSSLKSLSRPPEQMCPPVSFNLYGPTILGTFLILFGIHGLAQPSFLLRCKVLKVSGQFWLRLIATLTILNSVSSQ